MLIQGVEGIGTHWSFQINDTAKSADYYKHIISAEIQKFEKEYSRFLPDSKISKLNKNRILDSPSVEFLDLLGIASNFFEITSGLFNPAVGHILENRGYDSNYSFENKKQIEVVQNFDQIINMLPGKVELLGLGNIDLGGLGKGFLIDKLARIFGDKFDLYSFMINGGGDIYVSGNSPHEVILEHPFSNGYELGRIRLQNQALGCSSNKKRTWRDSKTGEVFGHILNPQSLSVKLDFGSFVVAKDALTADILATVVCLLGENKEKIREMQRRVDFEFVVVRSDLTMVVSDGFPEIFG